MVDEKLYVIFVCFKINFYTKNMKFTKQDAFESLKRELTNNGRKTLRMSERSLDKLTDNLINELADDEIGLPDFCAKVIGIMSLFNDNVGKDASDFIKRWESEHQDNPQKNDNATSKNNDDVTLQSLMERIAASENELKVLREERDQMNKEASIAKKRQQLIAKLRDKGVKDDDWIESLLSKVNLDREFEIDAEAEDLLPLYNKFKANGGSIVAPKKPSGDDNNASDNIDDVIALAKSQQV